MLGIIYNVNIFILSWDIAAYSDNVSIESAYTLEAVVPKTCVSGGGGGSLGREALSNAHATYTRAGDKRPVVVGLQSLCHTRVTICGFVGNHTFTEMSARPAR